MGPGLRKTTEWKKEKVIVLWVVALRQAVSGLLGVFKIRRSSHKRQSGVGFIQKAPQALGRLLNHTHSLSRLLPVCAFGPLARVLGEEGGAACVGEGAVRPPNSGGLWKTPEEEKKVWGNSNCQSYSWGCGAGRENYKRSVESCQF